jgi:hypothetical protein
LNQDVYYVGGKLSNDNIANIIMKHYDPLRLIMKLGKSPMAKFLGLNI